MYNEKQQLIINLKRIKDNDYNLSDGEKTCDYLDLMLKYIGDPDPELRDDLIYLTFTHWIHKKKHFSNEELCDLLNTLTSENYLFYNIGRENDDSVLRRSFSVLTITLILYTHLDNPFLDTEMILKTKNNLFKYLKEEEDLRGYDNEKGWMHALAHTSDGFNALLECEGITEEICKEFLLSVEGKLFEGKYLFTAEEDERLVNVIYYNIIENKLLSDSYICSWLEGLSRVLEIKDDVTKFKAKVNTKNLIRSLYFRMLHLTNNVEISNTIIELEKKLNSYLY
jgi:hypothetical protein